MEFNDIKVLSERYLLPTYAKYPLSFERGEGVYVFDSNGRCYLDLYGGHCAAVLGHLHPALTEALTSQIGKLTFYSNAVYNSARAKAAEALVNFAPPGLKKVFFCNSGAEAVENALKIAFIATGRKKAVAVKGDFHGRTVGALSVTGIKKFNEGLPLLSNTAWAEFGDIKSVKALIQAGDAACVIIEPIQSMNGVRMAEPEYYMELKQAAAESGTVLIYDEVQTGMGRTGCNFFGEGVEPDIICTAKGLGGGFPIGAVLAAGWVAKGIKRGDLGSTFGGSPLACAAAAATIKVITEEQLGSNAKRLGMYIKDKCEKEKIAGLKEVRGAGLLLGIEFSSPVKELILKLLEGGIVVGSSLNQNTLRLLPPLILKEEHCDEFIASLKSAAKEIE